MKNSKYSKDIEKTIFLNWKNNNNFKIVNSKNNEFTILMPPPNVTGNLHLGHAWDSYIQDTFIRDKKLSSFNVNWFPGMDHAGIATQSKIEEKLFNEKGLKRLDLGREKFTNLIWEWKEEYANNIHDQWDKLGLIADWKDESFTLDADVNNLVLDTFIDLYNQGYIYKAKKLINWDTKLKTAISDIEVIYKEQNSTLYNFYYLNPKDNSKILISTTRPETIFGDTGIFVNPNDKRYQELIGEFLVNPLNNKKIKVYADEYVDMDFGSGVMKATPAHDFNDYELAKKHNLEFINIMNLNGDMNQEALFCSSLSKEECRKKVVEFLESKNLLESVEIFKNKVTYSERSNTIIEPLITEQWFLKTSLIAKDILENKNSFNIEFIPQRFSNVFWQWLEVMEDWCISRQLWWGHQIPIWYNKNSKEMIASKENPNPKTNDWIRDEDVLDTWFSSALWPIHFSQKYNLEADFLSDYLVTGYDIIFFWVSRMIMMSKNQTKKWPFKKVFIHGLIRDKNGKKMSKSLGNGINPIEVIDKWGSDALRIFLLSNSKPGNDLKFDEKKINSSWDLLNKIFNINNLIMENIDSSKLEVEKLNDFDFWINEKFIDLSNKLKSNIKKGMFNLIYQDISKFIFDDFSSIYLEYLKKNNLLNSWIFSAKLFRQILICLHPYIPFLTEYIYINLPKYFDSKNSILLENYENPIETEKSNLNNIIELIKNIRRYRSKNNITFNKKISFFIDKDNFNKDFARENINEILSTFVNANLKIMLVNEKYNDLEIIDINKIFIISTIKIQDNKIDFSFEDLKQKYLKVIDFEYQRAKKIISNDNFIKNADPNKINEEKEKYEYYSSLIEILNGRN